MKTVSERARTRRDVCALQAALTKVDDELDDLESRDPLLPPNADSAGALEVVPVHDNMHGQVERDRHPRHGRRSNKLRVAQERSSAMVVAVKEGYFFLIRLGPPLLQAQTTRQTYSTASS